MMKGASILQVVLQKINDMVAKVDVDGVIRETSLMLMEDAQIGDYVIVHAGFAISKVDEEHAKETWELLAQLDAFNQTENRLSG